MCRNKIKYVQELILLQSDILSYKWKDKKKCVDVPAIKGEEITQISSEIDSRIK